MFYLAVLWKFGVRKFPRIRYMYIVHILLVTMHFSTMQCVFSMLLQWLGTLVTALQKYTGSIVSKYMQVGAWQWFGAPHIKSVITKVNRNVHGSDWVPSCKILHYQCKILYGREPNHCETTSWRGHRYEEFFIANDHDHSSCGQLLKILCFFNLLQLIFILQWQLTEKL